MKKIDIENLLESEKIKDGYIIRYNGKLNSALNYLKNMTTACFDTDNDINVAYTEGFNLGLERAKQILTK